jgi:hypothetical protein
LGSIGLFAAQRGLPTGGLRLATVPPEGPSCDCLPAMPAAKTGMARDNRAHDEGLIPTGPKQ